jgi:hypothetical protein
LKQFTDGYIDTNGKGGKDEVYDLYGIVIHSGYSANSGHYYSYCKDINKKSWYECNDSCVSSINSESQVLNEEAYLLFYQKRVKLESSKSSKENPEVVELTKKQSLDSKRDKIMEDLSRPSNQQTDSDHNNSGTASGSSNTLSTAT